MTGSAPLAPQTVRMFWAGPSLSFYEELCLKSFVAQGHEVLLYAPAPLAWVPEGVIVRDANEVLPTKELYEFVFPNGETSLSIHANLFRYEALRRFGGWWCDTDVVLLRPDLPAEGSYFAWEDETTINCAVLRFPPEAPLMQAAAEAARGLMSTSVWGLSGPRLLTRLAHELAIAETARPWTAAYPVRTTEVLKLFDPACREELEERLAGADFLHLWNQIWRRVRIPKELGPPEGSYLDGLFRRFDIRVPPYARLSHRAIESWFYDFNLVADWRRQQAEPPPPPPPEPEPPPPEPPPPPPDPGPSAREVELAAALAEACWERDELLRSTSWRVTGPLRAVIDQWRRLRLR